MERETSRPRTASGERPSKPIARPDARSLRPMTASPSSPATPLRRLTALSSSPLTKTPSSTNLTPRLTSSKPADPKTETPRQLSDKEQAYARKKSASQTHRKLEASMNNLCDYFEGIDRKLEYAFQSFFNSLSTLETRELSVLSDYRRRLSKNIQLNENQIPSLRGIFKEFQCLKRHISHPTNGPNCEKGALVKHIPLHTMSQISRFIHQSNGTNMERWHNHIPKINYFLLDKMTFTKDMTGQLNMISREFQSNEFDYNSISKPRKTYGVCAYRSNDLELPSGLAINPMTGHVYVSDSKNHRIRVLSPDLQHIATFGDKGPPEARIHHPMEIAISPNGERVAVKTNHNMIFLYNRRGQLVQRINGFSLPQQYVFTNVKHIAFDSSGRLYIFGCYDMIVRLFSQDGEYISSFSLPNSKQGDTVEGVFIDGYDNIIYGLSISRKIIFCTNTGTKIRTIDHKIKGFVTQITKGPQDGYLVPSRLTFGLSADSFYVCNSRFQIVKELSFMNGRYCALYCGRLYVLKPTNNCVEVY